MAELKLYPFQKEGVDFLTGTDRPSKLLADDMGLGKTVQVIAAMDKAKSRRAIIICPSPVKIHWARKIDEFSQFRRKTFIVENGFSVLPKHRDIFILNYELAIKPKILNQLLRLGSVDPFDTVVIDEAHYLKNPKAKRTKSLLGKGSPLQFSQNVILLTGTPILNRPVEMWPVLATFCSDLIAPYDSYISFGYRYCNGKKDPTFRGSSNLGELAMKIRPFMLRRKKEDVLEQLPDKVETFVDASEVDIDHIDLGGEMATVRRLIGEAKVGYVLSYARAILETVEKIVIFCHHRSVIEQLAVAFKESGKGVSVVYGGITAGKKQDRIDEFVYTDSSQVFIAQITAGGTGVDGLQNVANHVIFAELDWSPGVMDQAIDRLRRIGQKDTVYVHYIQIPGTLDMVMDRVLDSKRRVISRVILAQEFISKMSIDNLFERLVVGVERIASALESGPVDIGGLEESPEESPEPKKTPVKRKIKKTKTVAPDDRPEVPEPEAEPEEVETEPEPVMETEAPAPAVPTVVIGLDEVTTAARAFIGTGDNKAFHKEIIRNEIWPVFNTPSLDMLKEEHYPAVYEILLAGPDGYKEVLANVKTQ